MSSYPASSHHDLPPHPEAPTLRPKQSNPINTTLDTLNKKQHHSLSSSSKEAKDAHQTSNNGWQIIRRTKRKKLYSSQPAVQMSHTETQPLRYTHTGSSPSRTRRTTSTTQKPQTSTHLPSRSNKLQWNDKSISEVAEENNTSPKVWQIMSSS
jgi:hypothetical protein